MENKNADPNTNIVRNWLAGVGVVLVVLVAVTYAVHRNDTMPATVASDESSSTEMIATSSSETAMTMNQMNQMNQSSQSGIFPTIPGTMTTPSTGEAIHLSNQSAGDSVAIGSMSVTRKSWIAIKDSKGSILGAAIFDVGATTGSVPLLRATIPGGQYEAVIYIDDGDHIFDLHKDMLVIAADGSPVSTAFNTK
ncbi:MAG TPA: hypothetical protein VMU13_01835 [Candidatus Paceibacterota bacterium]|nr:hypothetical protein [Candidatus Paceibacterota bacterium]